MKGLCKIIGAGLISIPFLLGGCKKEAIPKQQYIKLQGTVFEEKYVPPRIADALITKGSEYSFSMDTEKGRKIIQVSSPRKFDKAKENLNLLIGHGTKVEIEIKENSRYNQIYYVPASRIKVLE